MKDRAGVCVCVCATYMRRRAEHQNPFRMSVCARMREPGNDYRTERPLAAGCMLAENCRAIQAGVRNYGFLLAFLRSPSTALEPCACTYLLVRALAIAAQARGALI